MPLYFAYGSNMNWCQFKGRCWSARFVCVAELRDHKLDFTRKSRKRCCGVADAVPAEGMRVCGVVYHINECDLSKLDQSEGYKEAREKNSYTRQPCTVIEIPVRNECEKRHWCVWTYFATKEECPPRPNQAYKDLIVSGAEEWGLPEDYIAELENIQVSQ